MAVCVKEQAHYSPPWAGVSIIGIAGSSGSGKSTLSHAIISQMNLPWVCILSMVIFFPYSYINKPINDCEKKGFVLQVFRRGRITKSIFE